MPSPTTIDQLISNRPRVYGWKGFQIFFLWFFLLVGLILFINTVIITSSGLVKFVLLDQVAQQISERYPIDKAEVLDLLLKYVEPLKFKIMLYSFFLSLSCFFLAYYCQKVLNRNRYILRLEKEWKQWRTQAIL